MTLAAALFVVFTLAYWLIRRAPKKHPRNEAHNLDVTENFWHD